MPLWRIPHSASLRPPAQPVMKWCCSTSCRWGGVETVVCGGCLPSTTLLGCWTAGLLLLMADLSGNRAAINGLLISSSRIQRGRFLGVWM